MSEKKLPTHREIWDAITELVAEFQKAVDKKSAEIGLPSDRQKWLLMGRCANLIFTAHYKTALGVAETNLLKDRHLDNSGD